MQLSGVTITGRASGYTIPVTDPYFSNVSVLLHADGTNGSTTFTDSSSNGYAFGANNTAALNTSIKRYGTASLKLNGSGDRITHPTAEASIALASSSIFTLEASIYLTANSPANGGGNRVANVANSNIVSSTQTNAWWWVVGGNTTTTGTNMQYTTWDGSNTIRRMQWNFPSTLNKNQWYDIAVVRDGSNWYAYLDGSLLTNATNEIGGTTQTQATGDLRIGSTLWTSYTSDFIGYIDEFRLTKGVARYTTAYTPMGPFPNS